ncbi:TVP38/TMEM64 family protein [Paenibacillus sepulcri]|uniref:TVP38/TMEM64 family membrane protein n=1 Tax=Paenibacillus sepulcri TaxID=359917 RepID=A0ABS7CC07_9BACL|nr:VTT domain-containing protein [Paenibacillus sepulcri]
MGEFISDGIDWLLEVTSLDGYGILLVTLPLAVIQGLLGFFPFTTLILLYISALGLEAGLVMSWLTGTFASVVIFYLFRYFISGWVDRKLSKRIQRYEKWQNSFQRYGIWAIIFLRTLPIMPNNLISFMSSVSRIGSVSYIWSSLLGNLSHIWLFGIISSTILMPGTDIKWLTITYIIFCLVLLILFAIVQYRTKRKESHTLVNSGVSPIQGEKNLPL